MTAIEFNCILVNEHDGLLRFAKKLTGASADAEDLVQDTFLKALRHRGKFDGSNLRAWLFTIMKNTFVNDFRRKKKSRQVISDNTIDTWTQRMSADFEGTLNARQIVMKIAELPNAYSHPFVSHYLGFKYEEIAASARLPVGTVKSRIFLARKMLRSTLLKLEAA